MILGRNPALWVGAVAALLNVLVIVFGVPLSIDGLAALNVAAAALIGLIANASDPTTAPTFAMTLTAPTGPSSSNGTASSTGIPSAGTPGDTTTDPTAGGSGGAV